MQAAQKKRLWNLILYLGIVRFYVMLRPDKVILHIRNLEQIWVCRCFPNRI